MTIYPDRPQDFTCAICQCAGVPERWFHASNYPIPPLCNTCAIDFGCNGGHAFGGWGDLNRDRRIARQVSALANALTFEATRIQHPEWYDYGRT